MAWSRGRWGVLGVVLLAAGCTDRPAGTSEETSGTTAAVTSGGTTGELSGSGTSGTSTGSSGAVDSTSSSSSSSDDGVLDEGPWCSVPGSGWRGIECMDEGESAFECDLVGQDCPNGEKCAPWANDGGAAWNASRCVPEPPAPDPVGAPCSVEGSAVSGLDSCELAALCWNVDPVTLEGECVSMCGGPPENFFCDDPASTCLAANGGALHLCLPACDPLLQDCAGGQLCVPAPGEGAWACVPPGSDVLSADGEPCEYLNVCAVGSVCVGAEVVPGCAALGCCAPLCDLLGEACADPGTECVPWYERGATPPELEALGLCTAVPAEPAAGWVPESIQAVRARL